MTEYSGFKYATFFMAEYLGMFAVSGLSVTLFLGGWHGPFLPGWMWFIVKVYFLIFCCMWIRATYPRYRYDQLMGLGWKVFLPLTLLNVVATGIIVTLFK